MINFTTNNTNANFSTATLSETDLSIYFVDFNTNAPAYRRINANPAEAVSWDLGYEGDAAASFVALESAFFEGVNSHAKVTITGRSVQKIPQAGDWGIKAKVEIFTTDFHGNIEKVEFGGFVTTHKMDFLALDTVGMMKDLIAQIVAHNPKLTVNS